MYQNIANQNPLLLQFNGYMSQNPNIIPFQNNQLINNNVHVLNNLNDLVKEHRTVQQNMPQFQQQMHQSVQTDQNKRHNGQTTLQNSGKKNINIIKEMLKPQKITKNNNKDVITNYTIRKNIQKDAKEGIINIKITNAPYKSIIKDKIITKAVKDVKEEDFIVHKSTKEIDANRTRFDKELNIKENEKEKINEELNIEFHIDNYDTHKKKFDYKDTFIKNLGFEQNIYDENKQDCIEFYRKKQKEAEEGQKLCDQILHNIIDEGIIGADELPQVNTNRNNTDIDLKIMLNNVRIDDDEKNNTVGARQKTSSVQSRQILRQNNQIKKTDNNSKNKNINTSVKKIHPVMSRKINTCETRKNNSKIIDV